MKRFQLMSLLSGNVAKMLAFLLVMINLYILVRWYRTDADPSSLVPNEDSSLSLSFRQRSHVLEDDIFIAVITSPQTINRIWNIHNTWGNPNKSRSTIRYMIGKSQNQDFNLTNFILQQQAKTIKHPFLDLNLTSPALDEVIQLDVAEGNTHHITKKTLAAWRYLYEHQSLSDFKSIKVKQSSNNKNKKKYKWFFKVDDDTFVLIPNLVKSLRQYQDPMKTPYLVGRQIKSRDDEPVPLASGGAGYLFSSQMLNMFASNMSRCDEINGARADESWGEDVLLSWCLYYHYNVTLTNNQGLNPYLPRSINEWRGWDKMESIFFSSRPISFHYAKETEMFELDYLLNMA
ncbi:hypothetical protein MP228_011999 [Amoeboaphelidium protococcarum]|nr:hypothetical protein MP228_011999 [Amoeboaphelidium protococcarum]